MRMTLLVAVATFCFMGAAAAQSVGDGSVPRSIGNRANGFDYQPTPGEVIHREKAAGVRPSMGSQQATDQELENLDRDLLAKEGLITSSVPNMAPR